jgi:hypothetical protein
VWHRVRIHLLIHFAPSRNRGVLDDGRLSRVQKLVRRTGESPPLRRDRKFESNSRFSRRIEKN